MTTPELIDRLEKWNWWAENTAKTFTKYTVTDKHFAELAEALTAAIAALRAAQEDNEKLDEAIKVLTYVDRQVREVWRPTSTYGDVHRAWAMEQADLILRPKRAAIDQARAREGSTHP